MVKFLVQLMLVAALACGAAAAEPSVSLRVEPDPPPADESFSLVFEASGDVDADPDFAPLERDFEIVSRNQQTSLRIVDGRRSRSTVWVLNVLPRHGGPLTVPAISFGPYATAPRELSLAVAPAEDGAGDDGLFLEVEASPTNPYVQQQVIYRLRLWRRYEISNATLSEPSLSGDAIVKALEQDARYEAERDGKRYEVIERRFAVFPQASGTLTIAPAVVTAQVVTRARSLFDTFSQPVTTKRVVSAPVALEVRPVPAAFPGGTWLPARRLSLHEEWQPDAKTTRVGEPLTRTVNLWADGLTAGQLPPIELPEVPGLKRYPDRPQTSEQQSASGFSAVLQRKTALIPERAGELALPAVVVPWWNTETDRLEYAELPAVTLHSEAVPGLEAEPVAPPPAIATQAATSAATSIPADTTTGAGDEPGYWRLLALLAAAGWLLTLTLWWRRPAPPAAADAAGPVADDVPAVEAALAAGDPRALATALLAWGRGRWPASPPRSLGALAARVDADFAAALWGLDGALYRPGAANADLEALRRGWRAARRASTRAAAPARPNLPELYPARSDFADRFTN